MSRETGWYLTYIEFATMENHSPEYTHYEPLEAETLENARKEAAFLWSKARENPYTGWGNSGSFPRFPRVIFQEPIHFDGECPRCQGAGATPVDGDEYNRCCEVCHHSGLIDHGVK